MNVTHDFSNFRSEVLRLLNFSQTLNIHQMLRKLSNKTMNCSNKFKHEIELISDKKWKQTSIGVGFH